MKLTHKEKKLSKSFDASSSLMAQQEIEDSYGLAAFSLSIQQSSALSICDEGKIYHLSVV